MIITNPLIYYNNKLVIIFNFSVEILRKLTNAFKFSLSKRERSLLTVAHSKRNFYISN